MAWNATGQPTVRKQRGKWVVRIDGIEECERSSKTDVGDH